jgi:hypothetical protein
MRSMWLVIAQETSKGINGIQRVSTSFKKAFSVNERSKRTFLHEALTIQSFLPDAHNAYSVNG